MIKWGSLLFFLAFNSFSALSYSMSCVEVLSALAPSNVFSVKSFGGSIETYESLKLNSMWNHPQESFHNNVVDSFIQNSTEKSSSILFKIMKDLKESDKIELLEKALQILSSDNPDLEEYAKIDALLTRKHDVILDFKLDNSPRIARFALNSQKLVKSVEQLRSLISFSYSERDKLLDLFRLVSLNADSTIKTDRFEDPSTVHLRPVPEEVVLLVYTIRHDYFDLFEALAQSPQIEGKLHLDYSVLLLDEIQRLPYESRSSYSKLAHKSFSPEALAQYNKGLRGADGTTMWDKIPIGTY